MKSVGLLSFVLLMSFTYSSYAQEYSYTHYDIGDGLAGSVVYCITQDKDGFIWVGTETGVSRFDGTHFKTFTVADGLPDIEVLEMFGDSKGRVWMAPFQKSVCYYYQGRIHNQDNDPLLRRIQLKENVENFAEDAAGNILILEKTAFHWVGADGSLRKIDTIDGRPIRYATAIARSASGHFLVQVDQAIFDLSAAGSSLLSSLSYQDREPSYISLNSGGVIYRSDSLVTTVRSFVTGRSFTIPFQRVNYKHLSFTSDGDSLFYINEMSGTTEINVHTGPTRRFLPGMTVSKTYKDAMGNTWFTTIGQGIYRLNSDEFQTIRIRGQDSLAVGVHFIRRIEDKLMIGDDHGNAFYYPITEKGLGLPKTLFTMESRNRVLYLDKIGTSRIFSGADGGLSLCCSSKEPTFHLGVKAIVRKNSNEFIVAAGTGVFLLDVRQFRITDTLWRERSTAVYYRNDTVYIGTLNGLYRLAPDRSWTFLGKDIPFLQKRISAVAGSPDGTLWIASYDGGVIGYRYGRVVTAIDRHSGLSSEICRTILVNDSTLWIGTDKGLNKVALNKPGYPVIPYTSKDGLGSDIINTIYVDGPIVYVGTPAGISYFDQRKVDVSQGCRLHLLSILNEGKDKIADTSELLIPYQDKHIRFEFVAISYRSVGDIVYRYRMLGLDTGWQETKENFLEYPILPSGKYSLQLQAVNKFGIHSALFSMPIEVATPFWRAAWFDALLIAAFLALVWLFVTFRIRRIRRQQAEKERLNHRLVELENTALQSQMNPHFIFNCLNSIQQYIFDQEALAANKYLTGFARLIRATLNNSSRTFIPLADEVDYLATYLSLERLRFKEKMQYAIDIDPSIDTDLVVVPPMLIQPFVENSMRHGLRHKTNGGGLIRISFALSGDRLRVIVEDNGIGRKNAAAFKTREHIEYQSKGMSLTADRIRTMNAKYRNSMDIEVIDLEDGRGESAGTRVVIHFPLFDATTQKEMI